MYHTIVDIRKINNLNCGLGQVAFHLHKNLKNSDNINFFINKSDLLSLKPDQNKYINYSKLNKYRFKIPNCKVWHAIHQDVEILPKRNSNLVLTIHDFNFLHENGDKFVQDKYIKQLNKKINQSSHVTFISEFTKNQAFKYCNMKNTQYSIIYNGVCFQDKIEEEKPTNFSFDKNDFYFSIGTVVEKKNFHVLCDLALEFSKQNFALAGSVFNDYGYDIQKKIKSLNLKNLILLGEVSENEKKWLFNNCKALIHPSKLEGFGLPLIEAFHYGKIVLCSNVCSLPEIGKDFAIYFDPFNIESIKESISSFHLQEQNLNSVTERKEYANSFSWENASRKYTEIYNNF